MKSPTVTRSPVGIDFASREDVKAAWRTRLLEAAAKSLPAWSPTSNGRKPEMPLRAAGRTNGGVTGVGIEPTTYGLKVRCSTD